MGDKSAGVLLSSAYLAPIQYFTKMVSYESVLIDQCESYIKQSFRNRAVILTSNGPVHLSIPVVDGPRAKGLIRDIKLSYDHQWQQIHWRGITSAYNNSPFFEYYADELAPFYHEKKWKYLVDFNLQLQDVVIEALNLKLDIQQTTEYFPIGEIPNGLVDCRYTIHPKPQKRGEDKNYLPVPYHQVFVDKFGFVADLSIIDLLCNEGPEAVMVLKRSSV